MTTIQQKAEKTLVTIREKMEAMKTIHLYHLTDRWNRLRTKELLLQYLLDENKQTDYFANEINHYI